MIKTITTTTVNGFILNAENLPKAVTVTLEGKIAESRAHALARKEHKNILISGISYSKTRYELDKDKALENATSEKTNTDDITLGETGTTVYYLRLADKTSDDEEYPRTVSETITFDAPMTESRAYGAARRALAFDILPYACEQVREKSFITREKFFELAKVVSDSDTTEGDEA